MRSEMLSFDPGVHAIAWAHFNTGGLLVGCGLLQDPVFDGLNGLRSLHHYVKRVVVECPQIYQQVLWKGDPNDLIDVARVVGGIEHAFAGAAKIDVVRPATWKGQVPKEVTKERVARTLDKPERLLVGTADCTPSLRHNMIDAIALGLWALGRKPKEKVL